MNLESHWLRGAAVLAIIFILQDAVLNGLRIDGIRPDLLLGLGLVAALVAGPELGAVSAFIAATVGDLLVNTPFGLSSLVACIVAFLVGSIQQALSPTQRWSIPVLTGAGSAVGVVTWAALATVLGLPGLLHPHLALIAGVVAVVNVAVSLPMARALRWAFVAATRPTATSPAPRGLAG